jgi:predicted RNA-binding protein with EMAP domain
MPYVNVDININTDEILEELSDGELIDELKRRRKDYNTEFVDGNEMRMFLQTIYEKRRVGKDYQSELDKLIYGILGKII